jgi:hypothetical protein
MQEIVSRYVKSLKIYLLDRLAITSLVTYWKVVYISLIKSSPSSIHPDEKDLLNTFVLEILLHPF